MKPDGVVMETVEPTNATVAPEPPSSEVVATHEEVTQQDPSPPKQESASMQEPDPKGVTASKKANGKPTTAAPVSKAKSTGVSSKKQPAPTACTTKTTGPPKPKPRPGSSTSHTVNGVKPSTNDLNKNTTLKKATPAAGPSASGAVPKKPVGTASSTVKTQTKVLDRKPVGTARTAAAPAAPLPSSRPAPGSGIANKKLPASPLNAAKSKLTGPTSKAASATAPKPSTPTATKAVPRTTRPPAGLPTSRLASSTTVSKSSTTRTETTATAKPTSSRPTSTRPAFSKAPAAPPTSKTAAVQPSKITAVAKKDGTKPSSTTAPKKPTVSSTATKKPEVLKPAVTKLDAASKHPSLAKAAQPKTSQPKIQDPSKQSLVKKAPAPVTQHSATNKQTPSKASHGLPASKPQGNSNFHADKRPKPTQSVQPFSATKTKPISNSRVGSTEAAPATATVTVAAETITDVSTVTQAEAEVALPEIPSDVASIPEVPTVPLAEDTTAETVPLVALETAARLSPLQSPVREAASPPSQSQHIPEDITHLVVAQEQTPAQTEDDGQIVAASSEQAPPGDPSCLASEEIVPTCTAPSLIAMVTSHVASSNLNEEDEDEEKEGSQQVSISDMSGTTQPTEESRPGSAGPAGPWRSGGALLSELDSEEVSCSQQGASELSAPGVLEGTESMDDLGDGSLKGASAGSPDFERVPDIPANDFEDDEDDEDDDDDRVCDMDVCSERAEDPQRARHDNEVDEEEEDEDVEMASEGVTESGLESYGNADEDDFAEDERLDNLNRAPHELPPPLLPSAPGAQWDQPNPFADPWAQPSSPQLQHEELLRDPSQPIQPDMVSQPIQPAVGSPASPSMDPWQADSETPTQSPAQAWLELGTAPFVPQIEEESDHLPIQVEPPKPEPQIDMDIGSPAPMDDFLSVPGTHVPSTSPNSESQPEMSSPVPMQNLSPALNPVLGISQSSTMSSGTSTPDEICDYNQEVDGNSDVTQAPTLQSDSEDQGLGIHMENDKAEVLPADEVLGGPAIALTSNLSEPQPEISICSPVNAQNLSPALAPVLGMSESSTISNETSCTEEVCDYNQKVELDSQDTQAAVLSLQPDTEDQDQGIHMEPGDRIGDEDEEAETLPADEVLGGPTTAPTSDPSSSSATEDEASDTEGEAQLEEPLDERSSGNGDLDKQSPALHSLSALEEQEEAGLEDECEGGTGEDATPPSANSAASYGFDTMTTASNSNALSTGESCTKSPGIFSLEELPDEVKDPCLIQDLSQDSQSLPSLPESNPAEQHYMQCGQLETEPGKDIEDGTEASDPPLCPPSPQQHPEDTPSDTQPPYFSAICEKTENSLAGLSALLHPHRRDHPAHPRPYCDIIKPHFDAVTSPRLSCADLPPRSPGLQTLSPQLRRLEQHQRQLLELQQRRELQNKPNEEEEERRKREEKEKERIKEEAEKRVKAEQELKRKEEEKRREEEAEEKKKKEEVARQNEELEKKKRDLLELQLQQQHEELKQRQQIMQWQQELEQQQQQGQKGQATVLLSPSSGLCTIYETLENSDDEEGEGPKDRDAEGQKEPKEEELENEIASQLERTPSIKDEETSTSSDTSPPCPDSPQDLTDPQTPGVNRDPQEDGDSSPNSMSPERPPPLDLDWGKKVDIVQQLINQTLLLTGDGCSSLLLLPGGGGGTLSPLESSLWPSLLPPLTPPSATVTSVSSFSPEAPGSSPQGEWTVVELETHH